MRRFTALFLLLFLASAALYAQVTVENVSPKVKFLPMESMDLNMRYSSEMQRLYVQVDFDVETARLDAYSYWGMFLNKNAKISGVMVNGVVSGHYLMQRLSPGHFDPVIAETKYLQAEAPVGFVGIDIRNMETYPDKVRIKFSYFLDIPEFTTNDFKVLNSGFPGEHFWYPHYLNGTTSVNLTLTTTQYFKLMLGNMTIGFKADEFTRTHQTTFFDMPGQPLSFRLMKE